MALNVSVANGDNRRVNIETPGAIVAPNRYFIVRHFADRWLSGFV